MDQRLWCRGELGDRPGAAKVPPMPGPSRGGGPRPGIGDGAKEGLEGQDRVGGAKHRVDVDVPDLVVVGEQTVDPLI